MENLRIKSQEIRQKIKNGDDNNEEFIQLLVNYINIFNSTEDTYQIYQLQDSSLRDIYTDDDIDCMWFDKTKTKPIFAPKKPGGLMHLVHHGIQDNILLCKK